MRKQSACHYLLVLTALTASAACSQEPAKAPDDGAYLASETTEARTDPAINPGDPVPQAQGSAVDAGSRDRAAGNSAVAAAPVAASTDPAPPSASTAPAAVAPDNTKRNERDRDSAALTPVDQGNGDSDLKITQKIRQAVMGNDTLSFTAKNVKIITANGKVTLRGPVKTDAERAAIEGAAKSVAGASQVDNQIEVKK